MSHTRQLLLAACGIVLVGLIASCNKRSRMSMTLDPHIEVVQEADGPAQTAREPAGDTGRPDDRYFLPYVYYPYWHAGPVIYHSYHYPRRFTVRRTQP